MRGWAQLVGDTERLLNLVHSLRVRLIGAVVCLASHKLVVAHAIEHEECSPLSSLLHWSYIVIIYIIVRLWRCRAPWLASLGARLCENDRRGCQRPSFFRTRVYVIGGLELHRGHHLAKSARFRENGCRVYYGSSFSRTRHSWP